MNLPIDSGRMRGVFLDYRSIDSGDLDRTPLSSALDDWRWYDTTPPDEVLPRIAGAEVVVSNKVPMDGKLVAQADGLRLICVAATGTDKIDLQAASGRNIPVCNVTRYATASVVQHVFGLMLALSTRLIPYHLDVRAGRWQAQHNFCLLDHPIRELAGKTLGIVGFGELGQAVARIGGAFGMQVLISRRPGSERLQTGRVPLLELLQQSDVISLHLPLAANTRNLIGARELASMKSGALLINTARGGIVDERALADSLRSGHLGGAGIDVLESEPPGADNPLLAPDIPNLILTPHTAWASHEARQRLLDEIALNIQAFRAGKVRNCVNCG